MRPRNTPDLSQVTNIDWARLAAYIDGEGSISIAGNQKQMSIRTFVCNTDPRLIMWCWKLFGGSVRGKPREDRKRHRPCWQWTVSAKMAQQVLMGCMPYFIIKKEQAEIALAFQDTLRFKGKGKHAPPEIIAFRQQCFIDLKRIKHVHMELETVQ